MRASASRPISITFVSSSRESGVVFSFGICSFSCRTAEFNAVHIYPNEEVVHDTRAGKTQRLAGQAFEACPQREMLALDLLHRQLSYSVLRGREMPPIDTGLVRVITS